MPARTMATRLRDADADAGTEWLTGSGAVMHTGFRAQNGGNGGRSYKIYGPVGRLPTLPAQGTPMDRRTFVRSTALAGVGLALTEAETEAQQQPVPEAIRNLKPMTAGIQPIS